MRHVLVFKNLLRKLLLLVGICLSIVSKAEARELCSSRIKPVAATQAASSREYLSITRDQLMQQIKNYSESCEVHQMIHYAAKRAREYPGTACYARVKDAVVAGGFAQNRNQIVGASAKHGVYGLKNGAGFFNLLDIDLPEFQMLRNHPELAPHGAIVVHAPVAKYNTPAAGILRHGDIQIRVSEQVRRSSPVLAAKRPYGSPSRYAYQNGGYYLSDAVYTNAYAQQSQGRHVGRVTGIMVKLMAEPSTQCYGDQRSQRYASAATYRRQ